MSENGVPLLEARGVGFCYPKRPLLRDISLCLSPGRVVALLGPNGSGKSTLLKVLLGLYRPCRGEVFVSGRSIAGMNHAEIACSLAYVPQHTSVVFAYTALEVVMMARVSRQRFLFASGASDRRAALDALADC